MNENCGDYNGMPVTKAKDEVKDMMLAKGLADVMHDLSEKVICRCGEKVIIKKIPDQWFIKYSDRELTSESKFWAGQMNILPLDYFNSLPDTLDWFQDRACVRKGNWFGTPFPFDESWIIEPISDSTLYPAYYTISHMVADGKLRPESMTEEFFDYLFIGRGNKEDVSAICGIPDDILDEAKAEFDYWYPLDVNLGGKEHMTVHFPVFLMNHVAVMPQRNWPQGIVVNWWIMMTGGKMSKSKGGAHPIPDAAVRFTVDGIRLYYSNIASPFADFEWSDDSVQNYKQRIDRIWSFFHDLGVVEGSEGPMDAWLSSRLNTHITEFHRAMDKYEIRDASNIVYYEMMADLRWYVRRGGANQDLIGKALNAWIRLLCPFTPHIAEELWELTRGEGLVSAAQLPREDAFPADEKAENAEIYLINVREDIAQILKTTGITPKKVCIYTAPAWKKELFKAGMDQLQFEKADMKELMQYAMGQEEMKDRAKEVSQFAARFVKDSNKFTEADRKRYATDIDESAYIKDSIEFLKNEVGCDVEVYVADDETKYDPKGRAGVAYPFKPAIYVE
ncbi:MAG: hypothetical protein AYK23_03820 [Candidatus Proteinoplasmatales archaeon SG8-5]|nr:MAG: hypothetical protein AYK23_03820 [Candidatus Proteinoplasmatales archaeon SG8-5]